MGSISVHGSTIIDLSQAIEPGIPVPVGFPPPQIETFLSQARGDIANVEILHMSVHTATHCDAPYHFFSELRSAAELPPDCLIGSAVVVDLTHLRGSVEITLADIHNWEHKSGDSIRPDDIVLLHTGHSKHWRSDHERSEYWRDGWPYLSLEVAKYFAEKPIRAVGVESFDPDWVNPHDLSTAAFPTHRTLLPQGIYIIENLTNLDRIPQTRCHVIALPLKLRGCSGSPVRVIAVV